MTTDHPPPRVLIIDDLFGRTHPDRRNEDRANLCGQYLLEDVTGDQKGRESSQKIKRPVAQAVFCRGQKPVCSTVGDVVENDLEGTLEIVRRGWEVKDAEQPRWALILLDLCFYTGRVTEQGERKRGGPGMPEGKDEDENSKEYFGLKILKAIHERFPDLPVVILSSKPRGPVSKEYSYYGAKDFLARNEGDPEKLQSLIDQYGLIPDATGIIIGRSLPLLRALREARRLALKPQAQTSGPKNVLIRGESGTGKELLARYLHQVRESQALDKSKPFVVVNSAVLTPELFASELFGIKKKTATGVEGRTGLIESADGGDLFFDEIRDMMPQVQAGILRVLEEGRITPVGDLATPKSVEVCFLSATNADIEAMSSSGQFRADLLERLWEGGRLYLPPLRERKEDIPLLAQHFLREAQQRYGAIRHEIHPEAMENLLNHSWPRNIRELRNCIHQAVRNHPQVEYLVPVHLELHPEVASSAQRAVVSKTKSPDVEDRPTGTNSLPESLEEVLSCFSDFSFDGDRAQDWVGKLPQTYETFARFVADYLEAALHATRKPTLDNPVGEVKIHPAVKLATGKKKLSASSAADVIKALRQLCKLCPDAWDRILEEHPLLKEAYETARRLRPSQTKKNSARTGASN